MGLRLINKCKIGFVLLLGMCMFTLSVSGQTDSTAVSVDSTAVSDTTAVSQTAAVGADTTSEAADGGDDTAAVANSSTSAATPAPAGTPAAEVDSGIPGQVYLNFFYYVFLVLLICFVIAIIGKVMSIYSLTRQLQGYKPHTVWSSHQGWFFLVALFFFLYGIYWSYVNHGAASYRPAATEHGQSIDSMFIITTILTTIVLVVTHILLFGFAFKYRGSDRRKAYFYPHNNMLERIWTIIPALVLASLVLFGFFTWRRITVVPVEEQKAALQVEVTGEQFLWTVRYGGRDNVIGNHNYKLITPTNTLGIDYNDKNAFDDIRAGDIVLPVGKPVRFTINSKDILHSFYIPEFRVQMNAVPGMPTYFQFTPIYTTEERREALGNPDYDYVLLCAKICGSGHYNMQKTIKVVSEEEYKQWLSEQAFFFNEDMQKEFEASQTARVSEEDTGLETAFNNKRN